jgi:uncharacterized membrane protein YfcA
MSFDALPASLIPFHDLTVIQIILLVLIYGATATIRGAFGFGAVAPAIVFSSLILEPHYAVILALVTGVWAQAQIVRYGLRNGDWKLARPLLLSGFAAIAAGVFIFKKLDPAWLTVCLGVVMFLIALADRYNLLDHLATKINLRRFSVAFGLSIVSGLIAGIAGGGGMYLYSVYLKFACPSPSLMRGTSIMIGSIFLFWRFLVAILIGLVSWRLLIESILLLPISMFGAWFGIRFFQRVDAKRFYSAFQAVLMLGALMLLIKGVTRAL